MTYRVLGFRAIGELLPLAVELVYQGTLVGRRPCSHYSGKVASSSKGLGEGRLQGKVVQVDRSLQMPPLNI